MQDLIKSLVKAEITGQVIQTSEQRLTEVGCWEEGDLG